MMDKDQYEAFKNEIIQNIQMILAEVPDSPLFENYKAKNLECYLRSLEILERIHRNG